MGLLQYSSYICSLVVLCSLLLKPSCSLNPKSSQNEEWKSAIVTWYGQKTGAGSDRGACEYGAVVENSPLSKMVTAVGRTLYDKGRGCGACYQIKCTENVECSGNPVTVVTTDECKTCSSDKDHFDLSGTAFGALAKPGKADNLRHAGRLQVKYTSVACHFGTNIALKVDSGSNPYYFSVVIEYENVDSNLAAVHLKQAQPSDSWVSMKRDRGAVWILNSSSPLRAPLSVKLAEASGETIVAENVIPADWKPGNTYHSSVNFKNNI